MRSGLLNKGCYMLFAVFLFALNIPAKADDKEKKKPANITELKNILDSNKPDFRWVRIKGIVDYEGEQNVSAATTIKMRKDSMVWASASVFIEAARMICLKDSTCVLDNLHQTYSTYTSAEAEKFLGMPGLGITALQRLLLAYPPIAPEDNDDLKTEDNLSVIRGLHKTDSIRYSMDNEKKRMTYFHYKRGEVSLDVTYDKFENKNGQWLPKVISILAESPEASKITINVSNYLLQEEDQVRFSIPESFSNGRKKE